MFDINSTNINKEIKHDFKIKNNESKNCNCRQSNNKICPLQGNCFIKNVVNMVRVKCNFRNDNKTIILQLVLNQTLKSSEPNSRKQISYILYLSRFICNN